MTKNHFEMTREEELNFIWVDVTDTDDALPMFQRGRAQTAEEKIETQKRLDARDAAVARANA